MGVPKIMSHISDLNWAVPWLRHLVTAVSPWRTRFNPRPVHVVFKLVRMEIGQVSLQVLPLSCHYHSTSAFYSFIYHWQYTTWAIDNIIKNHTAMKYKYIVQWDYHILCNNDWLKWQGDEKDEESAWCVSPRWFVNTLSIRRPQFNPGAVNVESVVDRVAIGHVSLTILQFFPCLLPSHYCSILTAFIYHQYYRIIATVTIIK